MTNQTIQYRLGTHRIQTPEKTLAKVQPMMASMGITRVADVTGLDTIGIPVVMVCRPNARSVSVSQGKGSTIAAAKASGLMESIEGYHAENMIHPLRIASYADLKQQAVVSDNVPPMDIYTLAQVQGSPLHANLPITWIEGRELGSGNNYWIPYELVHTNYTYPRPTGSGCFPASSNGLASGNSLDEAIVHGICEVVERDAISLWHQRSRNALDSMALDLDTVDSPLGLETIGKLRAANQQVFVWDITTDVGIPTYLSVILDKDSHSKHIGVGSGTHLNREVALARALHEAVQVRTTYIVGARDDITLDEYTPEGIQSKRRFFSEKAEICSFLQPFDRTSDLDSDSIGEDLQTVIDQLASVGIGSIFTVDLTKLEFGVAVVRVVIPELEPPHDDYGYMPGERAQKVQQEEAR